MRVRFSCFPGEFIEGLHCCSLYHPALILHRLLWKIHHTSKHSCAVTKPKSNIYKNKGMETCVCACVCVWTQSAKPKNKKPFQHISTKLLPWKSGCVPSILTWEHNRTIKHPLEQQQQKTARACGTVGVGTSMDFRRYIRNNWFVRETWCRRLSHMDESWSCISKAVFTNVRQSWTFFYI